MLKLGGIDEIITTGYHQCFLRVLWCYHCSERQNSGITKHLIQHIVIDSRVFSLGDFVLESLFCAQRL